MGAFAKKLKKKDKPKVKGMYKAAMKAAQQEHYNNKFLNKNLDRVINGRLRAMSTYALFILCKHYATGEETLKEFCLRVERAGWAINHSYKNGIETDTPLVEWRDLRHNLEREIRFKLPLWPQLGNQNELTKFCFESLDRAETILLDICRLMFGWGRVNLTKFARLLRFTDMAADYDDYLSYRAYLRQTAYIDTRDVDKKTFYDGKWEKPRIKYAF